LIFDSVFNSFRGIIAYFRVMNGTMKKGEKVKFFNTGVVYDADEVGCLKMDLSPSRSARPAMWATSSAASRRPAR
jgi:GTP-binding protein LepA